MELEHFGEGVHRIISVPFEGNISYGHGARDGPRAILESLHHVEPYDVHHGRSTSIDQYSVTGTDEKDVCMGVRKAVFDSLSNEQLFCVLGGDHSTSIGAVQACIEHFDEVSVIQLDAHPDLFYSWNNSQYNHRCFGYHASKAHLVQIGIRAADEDEITFAQQNNVVQHFDCSVDIKKLVRSLKKNVYVSIDVDFFDPSLIRFTGTPEPTGGHFSFVLELFSALRGRLVGFDMVEFAPRGEEFLYRSESYSLAKLLYQIFCIHSAVNTRI